MAIDHTDFDVAGIDELVSLCREAGYRHVELLACHETGAVAQVEVDDRLYEDRLAALERIDSYEYVSTSDNAHLYVVEFTAPNFPPSLAERASDLLAYDQDVTEHSITMSLVGPQTAIAPLVEEYEAAGLSPDLRKLGPYDGHDRPLDVLTDRQREVLCAALEMGYFEVPRGARTEDLAAKLELDVSTVAEHLQRAERNLLTEYVSGL